MSDEVDVSAAVAFHPSGSSLAVTVVPRASVNRLEWRPDGSLRVHVTAPPVDGAANTALVRFLARAIDHPRSRLIIASGETSRHKRIVAAGLAPAALTTRLREALSRQR